MKKSQFIISIVAFVLFLFLNQSNINAQNSFNRKYIKLIVKGVNTPQKARSLSTFIQTKSGVITSRMDYRTNIYFGIFEASSNFTLTNFEEWINSLGFQPKCGFVENFGEGRIKPIKISDCDSNEFKNDFAE